MLILEYILLFDDMTLSVTDFLRGIIDGDSVASKSPTYCSSNDAEALTFEVADETLKSASRNPLLWIDSLQGLRSYLLRASLGNGESQRVYGIMKKVLAEFRFHMKLQEVTLEAVAQLAMQYEHFAQILFDVRRQICT